MLENAKWNIKKFQEISNAQYNKKYKIPNSHKTGDLVKIKKTQFGIGLKLQPKYFGPYRIKTFKSHNRYEVEKVGLHDGPQWTSTAVNFVKWSTASASWTITTLTVTF